jgi:two-component system, chemotaxis family, response regulator PixG
MSSTSIAYANTVRTLTAVSQQRSTGELTLTNDEHCLKLYFFHGRLVYATGTLHRVRRWRRSLKQHCPEFNQARLPSGEPWEYQLLSNGVADNQVSVAQAQGVIKTSLEEVLFSWVGNPALSSDWLDEQRFSFRDNSALSLLVSSAEVERVLQQARQLWKNWKALELETLNPYRSPILRIESAETPALPSNLIPFLTGRYTLWDIAIYAKRPVTTVTRFLLPWVQRGAIALEEVPDLPNPHRPVEATQNTPSSSEQPLIACVDDSSTAVQFLTSILEPAGYRVLRVQDPLMGVATLTKHKPDLILMDLIMPNANGYDLCTFLKKTSTFQNTPIIVLTSQHGFIDRTRAKLAGASDFLTKPPDPQTLLNLVRSHLQSVGAAPSGSPPS